MHIFVYFDGVDISIQPLFPPPLFEVKIMQGVGVRSIAPFPSGYYFLTTFVNDLSNVFFGLPSINPHPYLLKLISLPLSSLTTLISSTTFVTVVLHVFFAPFF